MTTKPAPKTCGANTRGGKKCGRPAGWGTDHVGEGCCKLHGGCTPTQSIAAHRKLHEASIQGRMADMLSEYETDNPDPANALLEVVTRTYCMVQVLGALVGKLNPVWAPSDAMEQALQAILAEDKPAVPLMHDSLYGPDHNGDGKPHVLVAMYGDWLDRHAKACKLAIDAGIAERQVRLAESSAALLVQVIRGVLRDLNITETAEVGQAVAKHLRAIPTTAMPA